MIHHPNTIGSELLLEHPNTIGSDYILSKNKKDNIRLATQIVMDHLQKYNHFHKRI